MKPKTLLTAIEDNNPVLFFEHKKLYRSVEQEVPQATYQLPFGVAQFRAKGTAAVVITYGQGVHWALKALQEFPENSVSVLDLNTLQPWDRDGVFEAVKTHNKVLLLQEDSVTGGFMGEVAAAIGEHCFEYLDGPVVRVGAMDTPIPFAPALEAGYLPETRLLEALQKLLVY